MSPEPIIHIEGLHKHFGETAALNGVSLDVFPGEVSPHHRSFRLRKVHPAPLHQPAGDFSIRQGHRG